MVSHLRFLLLKISTLSFGTYDAQYTLTGPDLRSSLLEPSLFSSGNTTIFNNSRGSFVANTVLGHLYWVEIKGLGATPRKLDNS